MEVNMRSLVGKLNDTCRRTLEAAAGLCLSRTNYSVEVEHWLLKLLEVPQTDLAKILAHADVDHSRLEAALTRSIDGFKTGNGRVPAFSPLLADLIRDAWLLASVEFGETAVRTGHLLLAAITNSKVNQLFVGTVKELTRLAPDALARDFRNITAGSAEEAAANAARQTATGAPAEVRPGGGSTPALDAYTIDLTARAKAGEIDVVSGRDSEIRQIVDILMRRRQNNPILTGEAGVGKTAVVEGFALRISQGDVPPPLLNVAVRVLDLGLLQAGAGVKGEFENRLKSVIQEVKASPKPIILFIDEAHTLIGAGGQAGQSDAANLLKPALARGELRTICATTWSEYKQYFEKDAALTRRFQVVKVEEPVETQAEVMLHGLVPMLERHHQLHILDEAVTAAVRLSHRYITGRQLPDKAVSLLDTSAARVAVGHSAIPAPLEDMQRQIQQVDLRLGILGREAAAGANHDTRIAELKQQREELQKDEQALQKRWEQERDLVLKIRDLREKLAATVKPISGEAAEKDAAKDAPKVDAAALRTELKGLQDQLKEVQGKEPLMQPCVDFQAVAEVVSGWTGIPVGKMLTDEIELVSTLHERMTERVIGQDHALRAISRRIQTARANLTDPRRPIGVFLLVGPSGVGKTETAMTLAEMLYGGEKNMVIINMTEFQQSHTTSTLIGSAPGLVGYGKGGKLTEAVRRRPYCVVLLDEIEKAHDDVLELFYQVFDKGTLEDAEGREIDFKNTIILCTSNTGSDLIQSLCADPETRPEPDKLAELLRPKLLERFKPAYLGRMTVVPYQSLGDEVLRSIIRLQLDRIGERLTENHRAKLVYSDAVVDQIYGRCRESETGARNVDHILTGTVLPDISRELLARLAEERSVAKVEISADGSGGFQYQFE